MINNLQADINQLEDQIEIMDYKLSNLTNEKRKMIDPDVDKIISEKEYEKFELE